MLLNQEGFRVTEQRQKILAVLKEVASGEHLSAEDVFQKLSRNGEKIGFSTIYRALHLLVDLGILRELSLSEVLMWSCVVIDNRLLKIVFGMA
jgi:Fur family ferric uptake transcriptional regulator